MFELATHYRNDSLIEEPFYAMSLDGIALIRDNKGIRDLWTEKAVELNPQLDVERWGHFCRFLGRDFNVMDCFFAVDFKGYRLPDFVPLNGTMVPIMVVDPVERLKIKVRVMGNRVGLQKAFNGYEGYYKIREKVQALGDDPALMDAILFGQFRESWIAPPDTPDVTPSKPPQKSWFDRWFRS